MVSSTDASCSSSTRDDASGDAARTQSASTRENPPSPGPAILQGAPPSDAAESPAKPKGSGSGNATSRSRAPLPDETQPQPANPDREGHQLPRSKPPGRLRGFLISVSKAVLTLLLVLVAALASLLVWDYYVVAPWTRDGRVRVQVASIAPQVSGQITQLRVVDNQYVKKGDILYVIDPFDFQRTLASTQTDLRMKAADLQVKKAQAERRQKLSDLATTAEQQQQYVGNAVQAEAAFDGSQQQVSQAEINLKRTAVKSPVNGFVTNLLMRVGDYAREGTTNISVIDADSYWIDGYFEETKMARVCVGDRVEAQLMGYRQPIIGRVGTVTRGISVSDASPSTQGLPNVDPVYTWVRLAQRVPVRVAIIDVPSGIALVSGMTASVTVIDAEGREGGTWLGRRWTELKERLDEVLHQPRVTPDCISAIDRTTGETVTLPELESSKALTPDQVTPGLTPSITASPKQFR